MKNDGIGKTAAKTAVNTVVKLIVKILLIVLIVFFAYVFLSSKVNEALNWSLPVIDLGNLAPDPVMGYKSDEIKEIIVGEARDNSELIVYEQDLAVTDTINDTFLNIEIFKKSQSFTTYGTGLYTVNLSNFSSDDINIDEENKIITISVPKVVLKDVTIDESKTTFEDIDREILGWGDIKLTPEQQSQLRNDIKEAFVSELSQQSYLDNATKDADKALINLFKKQLVKLKEDVKIVIVYR